MKTTILVFISSAAISLLCSCETGTVGTAMQPRTNVEQLERKGQDVRPNNNNGQHAASANAIDYSNPGHRGDFYGLGRGIPGI